MFVTNFLGFQHSYNEAIKNNEVLEGNLLTAHRLLQSKIGSPSSLDDYHQMYSYLFFPAEIEKNRVFKYIKTASN